METRQRKIFEPTAFKIINFYPLFEDQVEVKGSLHIYMIQFDWDLRHLYVIANDFEIRVYMPTKKVLNHENKEELITLPIFDLRNKERKKKFIYSLRKRVQEYLEEKYQRKFAWKKKEA